MKSRRRIGLPRGSWLRRIRLTVMQLQQGFAMRGIGLNCHFAGQQFSTADVRFVPTADSCTAAKYVSIRDWNCYASSELGH
jgi:hypothetical protein